MQYRTTTTSLLPHESAPEIIYSCTLRLFARSYTADQAIADLHSSRNAVLARLNRSYSDLGTQVNGRTYWHVFLTHRVYNLSGKRLLN